MVSIAVPLHHDHELLGEGKGLFYLITLRSYLVTKGSWGRNVEARTEAEGVEKGSLLVFASWFA